jgi:hypothetical protein
MATIRTSSIIVLCAAVLLSGCKTNTPETPPKNLDEAIAYFENHWNNDEKTKFKILPEKEAVSDLHLSIGMWIRNTWIHGNRDTSLTNYFHTLGIFHPDDMSAIILTSLHRKLNDRNIDLQAQVKSYQDYWTPVIECQRRQRNQALATFQEHSVGDQITILMAVDTSDGARNAIIYECPNRDWTFNPKVDLMVAGIITKKYFIKDSLNVFFTVYIKKLNHPNTTILMENAKVGDSVNFHLSGLTIK